MPPNEEDWSSQCQAHFSDLSYHKPSSSQNPSDLKTEVPLNGKTGFKSLAAFYSINKKPRLAKREKTTHSKIPLRMSC